VSLQVAILKVLSSYPKGRASVAALSADLAILNSSGSDWTSRMKRLAARAPQLDIFSQRLVLRDAVGWQLTDAGRQCLCTLETPVIETPLEVVESPQQIDVVEPPIELPMVSAMSSERSRVMSEPIRHEPRFRAAVPGRQSFAVIEGGKA
jgi:hypothetical protein